ncbi:MAG: tetratricopeptide repeat protein [Burkholderiales bacterium]|nr:tetratricopeptide repeat protein [Burkholderiales bacterium]
MYDPDEQQQLDEIKAWLKRHGKWLLAAIVIASVASASYFGYRHYEHARNEKASALFDALSKMQDEKDLRKIRLAASTIMESFPKTAYAARAAMIVAQSDFDAGETNDAKLQLQWALDHSQEPELRDVARLRLARVLFDEKKYADAIAELGVQHDDAFDGLYSDLKGDIFLEEGKLDQARSAYLLALNKTEKSGAYHDLIQVKLDSTGGGK